MTKKKSTTDVVITDLATGEILQDKAVKIRTPFSRLHHTVSHEKGGGVSMTVPDQAMSIRELIKRSQRGYPLDADRPVFFNGEDDDMPDIKNYDLSELQELSEWTNRKIKETKDHETKQYREKLKKETEAFYKKKFEKEQQEKTPDKTPKPSQRDGKPGE